MEQKFSAKELHKHGKGLHILMDMYGVKKVPEMTNAELLEKFCSEKVKESGLTEVGKVFHKFEGDDSGVTGTIIIAESHLCAHLWPEYNYVTLDVFVCNVTGNNHDKARKLANYFVALFQPEENHVQEIERY